MTMKNMRDDNLPDSREAAADDSDSPALSRRALLKGSVATMPAILTLHSGAALARSSNLISETPYATTDSAGRTLCLDVDSVYPAGDRGGVYDLGEPAYGRVTAINDRDYKLEPRYRAGDVSEAEMCERGGRFYYRTQYGSDRWREVHVKQGILVSATALTSFAGDIVITDL